MTRQRPQKPTADFPLYAHASGKWAKKIGGQIRYFGRWPDPDGALREYESFAASQSVRNVKPLLHVTTQIEAALKRLTAAVNALPQALNTDRRNIQSVSRNRKRKTSMDFKYDVKTLAALSGWQPNRFYQDVRREDLRINDLRSVAVWLASNGLPEFRTELAIRLIPTVLGARVRPEANVTIHDKSSSHDFMFEVFRADRSPRNARADKIRNAKAGAE